MTATRQWTAINNFMPGLDGAFAPGLNGGKLRITAYSVLNDVGLIE